MAQNLMEEIEALKKEVAQIKSLLHPAIPTSDQPSQQGEKADASSPSCPVPNMHADPRLNSLMNDLFDLTEREGRTGSVTYLGVFASGGRQLNNQTYSFWIQNGINTDDLLSLIENKSAAAVLQCIGSSDRLALLLALLRVPSTVASLVERCGFHSTGQVYHHLRPLIAADLVFETEDGRGVYAVKPHRVQGVIMLLAGIFDLTDQKYSQGAWPTPTEEGE